MFQVGRFNVTIYRDGHMKKNGEWLALIVIDEFDENDKPLGHKSFYGQGDIDRIARKLLYEKKYVEALYAMPEHTIFTSVDVVIPTVA